MAEVHLDNVTKVYQGSQKGGVKAVDNVTIHIDDGEFVVLVGPSGCGKSTTLRMVAGLEEITGGTITIGGRVVNDVAPKDRDIAMVFQNYALYPHMSVYQNMAFGLKLRKIPKKDIDRRVRDAAKTLGIEHLLDRKPKALSGGQRQRVAVGRAIVREPACFLFDEPLSNLDAKLRVETRAELKRLHRRLATTSIYVTHDQEEAMTLGDRIVVMSEGEVQQADSPLVVYQQPSNRFVAGFVGTPPMNFVEGQLLQRDGSPWFEGQGVSLPMLGRLGEVAAGHVGQNVVLGLRPEALSLRSQNNDAVIPATAGVIEPLGGQMDVFTYTREGHRLVARVKAEHLEPETQLKLGVDLTQAHLFETGPYGRNLTQARELATAAA